jgi:hypothetical protein
MTGASLSFAAAYRSILNFDGGSRIFHDFGFTVGERTVSPFRTDARKKNFSVYRNPRGEVCFKDFASGDGGTFTALLHGFGYTTFEAQIRFAARLYNIELKESPVFGQKSLVRSHSTHSSTKKATKNQVTKNQVTNHQATKNQRRYRVTALELADFTPVELETLARISGGCITRELLERFGIRALRSYTDEGVSPKGVSYGGTHKARFTLVVPSADGNYYGYCYFGADAHSPFPHRSKNFHLKLNDYTAELKFALGLNELRPKEAAYIVEGIKDCLILLAKGYNAFTLGGVQHRLLPSIVQRLHENGNSLSIVFDTDFAGINAAKRLVASLSTPNQFLPTQHSTLKTQNFLTAQHCFLPRLDRQETKDQPKPALNDLADYVTLYGFDDELRSALARPNLVPSITVTRSEVSTPAIQLTVTRSISEAPEHLALLRCAIDEHSRLALYAPTGCGKTFSLLRHIAPYRTGRTIFTVPTVALAEQIDREYGNTMDDSCKLVCITGKDDPLTLLEARTSAKIIVCTYNSLPKVLYGTGKHAQSTASLLDDTDTLLVVDEAHKLHEEQHFRREAIAAVFHAMRHAPRVLLMSATPSLLWGCDRTNPYTHLAVQCRERNTIHCTPLQYSTSPVHAVVHLIVQERAKMPDGVMVVRINSAHRLRALQAALAAVGLAAENIDRITAKSRDASHAYKSIMETGVITTDIVLTTSALDCGVNINNTNIAAAIMVDETNPNAIEQFANRFRRMNTVPLFLLNPLQKKNDADNSLPLFAYKPAEYFERHLLNAEMQAQIYTHGSGRTYTAKTGISSRSKFAELNDHVSCVGGEYFPHIPALIAATEALTLRTGRSTLEELAHAGMTVQMPETLEAYYTKQQNTKHLPQHETTSLTTSPISHLIDEAYRTQASIAKQEERVILTMLAETPALFMETLRHTSFDTALKQRIGRFFADVNSTSQSEESKALATKYAALWQTNAPERLAKRYLELRALHLDHDAAALLVERFKDDRRWKNFMENLAMHQRLELDAMNYATTLLSTIDREKLKREKEIRAMVAASAEHGCVIEGKTTRHEKNALKTKAAITERVNAFRNPENRLTKQQAGALVDALFFCTYKRERSATTTKFNGYYAFEAAENSPNGGVRRKTLAEFMEEAGVNGQQYAEAWANAMHRAVQIEEWERQWKNKQEAQQIVLETMME